MQALMAGGAGPSPPFMSGGVGCHLCVVVWGPHSLCMVLGACHHSWLVLLGSRHFSWMVLLGSHRFAWVEVLGSCCMVHGWWCAASSPFVHGGVGPCSPFVSGGVGPCLLFGHGGVGPLLPFMAGVLGLHHH